MNKEQLENLRDFARSTLPGSGVVSRLNTILATLPEPGVDARTRAMDTLLSMGWKWNGFRWEAPAAPSAPQGGGVSWQTIESVLERARGSLGAAGGVGSAGAANSQLERAIGEPLIDWIEDELRTAQPAPAANGVG